MNIRKTNLKNSSSGFRLQIRNVPM